MSKNLEICPICQLALAESYRVGFHGLGNGVSCNRCGKFDISEDLQMRLSCTDSPVNEENRWKISGILRNRSERGAITRLVGGEKPESSDNFTFKTLLESEKIPTISEEKILKLLEYINHKQRWFGDSVDIQEADDSVAFAKNVHEFEELIRLAAKELELIKENRISESVRVVGVVRFPTRARMGIKGERLLQKDRSKNLKSKKVFIATWFPVVKKEDDEKEKGRKEKHSKHTKAAETAIKNSIIIKGKPYFEPILINKEDFNGTIFDEAIAGIRSSRFVVIDLSGQRNAVFFEAGFARGLNVETIFICHKPEAEQKENQGFYPQQLQILFYENEKDLIDKLIKRIQARFGGADFS